MKSSIIRRLATVLGLGFSDSAAHIEPSRRAPSKKQTRQRSARRFFGGTDSTPIIHTESNAAARRLRQMQRGMLKPASCNIHAHISQAIA